MSNSNYSLTARLSSLLLFFFVCVAPLHYVHSLYSIHLYPTQCALCVTDRICYIKEWLQPQSVIKKKKKKSIPVFGILHSIHLEIILLLIISNHSHIETYAALWYVTFKGATFGSLLTNIVDFSSILTVLSTLLQCVLTFCSLLWHFCL